MKVFCSSRFIASTAMSANDAWHAYKPTIALSFCFSLACLCFMAWSSDGMAATNNADVFGPATEIRQNPSTTDSSQTTQTSHLRASYHACLDASDGVTEKVLDCISTEFAYQDARLNRIYQKLRSTLPPQQKLRLRDEERRWLSEGLAACNSTADGGGTADLLNTQSCSLKRTADRADALEKLAENKQAH